MEAIATLVHQARLPGVKAAIPEASVNITDDYVDEALMMEGGGSGGGCYIPSI